MGNGAILATIALVGATLLLLFNTQVQSQETGRLELEQQANQVARDLAMTGRKLVLADWVESNGTNATAPFTDVDRDGGHIHIDPAEYSLTGSVLDFKVLASYDSVAHEVRSRFQWSNFNLNALQLKVGDLTPTISASAQLNFNDIALDNTSLMDLETILINDLSLAPSLGDLGLGFGNLQTILQSELTSSGNGTININMIDQAFRDAHSNQDGVLYPDQVSQAVEEFTLAHPAMAMEVGDLSGLSGTFGMGDGMEVLTISSDLTLDADFQGQGILVVEGDFVVPDGYSFEWDGVVLVKPPAENLNPSVDFSGNVDIEGSFIALHEGMPNIGHMDLSVYRDMSGFWSSPTGTDAWDADILKHTHDYTASEGNFVVFHSIDPLQPDHEAYHYFNATLGSLASTDSVFLEIYNESAHGLGLISLDLTSGAPLVQTVQGGFDEAIKHPVNAYRTKPMHPSEIENFDIRIGRLSSLKKMWDVEGVNYPGCFTDSGPECVWHDYNRQGALTLRLYKKDLVTEKKVYAASLYWHKRADEDEDFNDEMADLVSTIQSSDYGLDLNIGDNTSITSDIGALLGLGAFSNPASGFGSMGVAHLGTWHRQWDRDDLNNPLNQVVSQ